MNGIIYQLRGNIDTLFQTVAPNYILKEYRGDGRNWIRTSDPIDVNDVL